MKNLLILSIFAGMSACNEPSTPGAYKPGSFGYDVEFLKKHDSIIVLANGESQIIISPKYQAKVFTSTATGMQGNSFGWINYKAFTAPVDPHMNAYGGENRMWLGPEGGKFSLFFSKDSKMVFENWKTPAAIDTEPWSVTNKSDNSVTLKKSMQLTNYAGTNLSIEASRSVVLLTRQNISELLQVPIDTSVNVVGYETVNSIVNSGKEAWTETTGMPCIWILDMLKPSPKTVIAIPFKAGEGKVATTDYFGEILADRIKYVDSTLLFKADGKSRGKLGLRPTRAMPAAGSYDVQNNVLTITIFGVIGNGQYLNQEWNTDKPPFSGDAMNAYNDGPLEDGSQMGPFYEIESVSPAEFLAPGETSVHSHLVFHLTGNKDMLDTISQRILQISLADISNAF